MIASYSNPRKTREVLWFALKKKLLRFGFGVFGRYCQKESRFRFFWLFFYYIITRIMNQTCGSKFVCILGWNMKLKSPRSTFWRFWCQCLDQKTPNHWGICWVTSGDFPNWFLIFLPWLLNQKARKSIKPSKNSYCSLESKKIFERQNRLDCSTPRGWRHHPNVNKYA